jgi:hypothetical protein
MDDMITDIGMEYEVGSLESRTTAGGAEFLQAPCRLRYESA